MSNDVEPDPRCFRIRYDAGTRYVRCFCGEEITRSVVPHLRKQHEQEWERWGQTFVDLANRGLSARTIMKRFLSAEGKLLLSWTTIEKEIKRIVERDNIQLRVKEKDKIKEWQPKDFELEQTSFWSFPRRGRWAVHQSDYRGNWPPQVPRNLILRYTQPNQTVLDPFVGGGTTLIEAWLLGRKGIGVDVSPHAIRITSARIEEMNRGHQQALDTILIPELRPLVIRGDARNLAQDLSNSGIHEGTIDLVCAHPPYLNTLKYTEMEKGDLSHITSVQQFTVEIQKVALQILRVLKKGGKCAVLVGDIRRKGRVIPLGFRIMESFLNEGYTLVEIIVKQQHQDKSIEFYFGKKSLSYLLAHEYLFIFEK